MPESSRHACMRELGTLIGAARDHSRSEARRLGSAGGVDRQQERPHGLRGQTVGHSHSRAESALRRDYERVNLGAVARSRVVDMTSLEK